MNPYLQVLEAAQRDRRTHHERAAEQTRAHFQKNPQCRRIILSMDREGEIVRGKGEIDIEARCQPGWFKPSMWKDNQADETRPIEQARATQTVWIEIKSGRAVEANTFMKLYLRELHRVSVISPHASQPDVRTVKVSGFKAPILPGVIKS